MPAGLVIQIGQEQLVPVGDAGLQHILIRLLAQFGKVLFNITNQRSP